MQPATVAGADAGETLVAVVPPGQHLEHDRVVEVVADEPLAEQPHQRLGGAHHLGDALGAVRRVRVRVQVAQVLADLGVDAGAVAAQQRLGEPGEHHAAREVGDRREADLRRGDEPLQRETGGLAQRLVRRRFPQPLAQHGRDDRRVAGRALLGEEDPEHGGFERRGALQIGDAVVPERLGELGLERLRQPGPLDVEALQVGVEVLAGAVHVQVTAAVLARRPVAAQLGEVGEDVEERDLLGQRPVAVLGGRPARGEVVVERPALVVRVDVEAEQQAAQVLLAAGGRSRRRDGRAPRAGPARRTRRPTRPRPRRRRAAPAAAAARRSPPCCPRTRRIPSAAP